MLRYLDLFGIIDIIKMEKIKESSIYLRNSYDINIISQLIKQKGLLNPIIVKTEENDIYEIVSGHRRYYSFKALGYTNIPCHIISVSEKEAFEVFLTERAI